MVKLFDFEYHVGIWFKYDRFGSHSSWPPLGLPLMVWYTEINSSDTFWPFPKCLKIDTFCEIGHFGKEASNPKMQEKKHVKKCEPICEMTFFYLTSHSNLCLIFKKIHDMPIQQIGSNFCSKNGVRKNDWTLRQYVNVM